MLEPSFAIFLAVFVIVTIMFGIITFLILKNSQDNINRIFAITPGVFCLNFFFTILENVFSEYSLFREYTGLSVSLLNITGLIAPLGLFYSAFMILYGESVAKSLKLTLFTILYLVIGFFFISTYFFGIQIPLNTDSTFNILNFMFSIPLFLGMLVFIKIYQISEGQKNRILTLIIGTFISSVGLMVSAISNQLGYDLLPILIFALLIGVSFVSISFINYVRPAKS